MGWVLLHRRCRAAGKSAAPLTGTTDWQRRARSREVPAGTHQVSIGAMLLDGGTGWLDDVKLNVVRAVNSVRCGAASRRIVAMVAGELFLVLLDLAVELVGERVDRGVHVGGLRVGVDGLAGGAMNVWLRPCAAAFRGSG